MTGFYRHAALGGLAVLVLAVAPSPGVAPVVAQSNDARYAAIVVDAASGEVLFERRADLQRFPASVTKVMTLYLAFEALSQGKISLDDELTISPLAASQAPSKLGLAAGQKIRLDDAMRATAVRSANDMAMAIAEHVGGSQARFGEMATRKAQQLGMTHTRYVNPNGLPDSRQVTSARDLATLSRAVMRDYPQYYSYFGQHDWSYQGRQYRNTNGLLLGGNGYDGIKTGYTNASGYNLAASAVRDGRRIITIVLGGRSSITRNAHVAELMNTGFEVESRRARGENIQIAQTFFEQRGFGLNSPEPDTGVAYASLSPNSNLGAGRDNEDGEGSNTVAYTALPARPVALPPATTAFATASASAVPYTAVPYTAPPPRPAAVPLPTPTPAPVVPARAAVANTPPASLNSGRPPANMTAALNGSAGATGNLRAPAPANAAVANGPRPAAGSSARPTARANTPPPAPAGRWTVQVGAFREESVARTWLADVNRRFRTEFASAERDVQTANGWYRSRFTGLTQDRAEAACAALSAKRVTCAVIRPG